ncbi:MAG: type II toxin-antitoxin system PemK/MazF family toxin [Candidatus Altiarchaeota archaeon]
MGSFTKGDIVLFPFPYTDLTDRKLRPCLVLSDEMGEDIILCQITSQKIRKDDYSVEVKQNETLGGSLRIDSLVRANMIFTANKNQILRKICRVNDKQYKDVVDVINNLMKHH